MRIEMHQSERRVTDQSARRMPSRAARQQLERLINFALARIFYNCSAVFSDKFGNTSSRCFVIYSFRCISKYMNWAFVAVYFPNAKCFISSEFSCLLPKFMGELGYQVQHNKLFGATVPFRRVNPRNTVFLNVWEVWTLFGLNFLLSAVVGQVLEFNVA